jgi:hypothetical protein
MIKRLTYLLFLLPFVLLSAAPIWAQHCPFDGAHLVVVHLTQANKPVTDAAANLRLREINQLTPFSCTYARGVLSKPFQLPLDIFKRYKYIELPVMTNKFCRGCTFLEPGYYAVNLNMAEETCMIEKGDEFDYRQREFEVEYASGSVSQKVKIPKNRVYSLCTYSGKWSRIVPVEFRIRN